MWRHYTVVKPHSRDAWRLLPVEPALSMIGQNVDDLAGLDPPMRAAFHHSLQLML